MATLLRSVRYLRLSCGSDSGNSLRKVWWLSKYLESRAAGSTALRNNLQLSYRCLATENVQRRQEQPQQQQWRTASDRRSRPLTVEEQQQKLDRALYKLDVEVRKTGRISMVDVKDIFNEIKTAGLASPTQSLLVIRCCGSLLSDELPKDRIALVDDIWKTLRTLKIQLDVSHYNARLKVYLENEHRFSSTDFLADMEANGVVSNRVTYQRLIAHFCQLGDMSGASKILDFMKQKDLPINENVFNSLIQGHTRANDFESAKAILDVMKNAKLEPSADTYTNLIRGYAEKGDIEGVRSMIKQADANDVNLLDKDYMDVLVALSVNGHPQYADEIMAKLRRSAGYNQDAINAIYQLVNAGQDDIAFSLLLTMPRQTQFSGEPIPSGRFFIRQMVKVGRPVEKILETCNELKKLSMNDVGVVLAAESALIQDRPDYAVAFLKAMKDQGHPIRPHYFWRILTCHRKHGNEAGVYETLRLMSSMDAPADTDTLLDYVVPAISLNDPALAVGKLKELGFTVSSVIGPVIAQLVATNNLQSAVQLATAHSGVRLTTPASTIRQLAAACHKMKNLDCALELLSRISQNSTRDALGQRTDWIGTFLLAYVRGAGVEGAFKDLETLIVGLKNRGLNMSNAFIELILERAGQRTNVDQLTQLLEGLSSSSFETDGRSEIGEGSHIPHPREMNLEELESHYMELKAKNMSVRGILRRLIFQYCRVKDLNKALEMKQEFDAENMTYTPAIYAQLMELHVTHSKLDDALDYFAKMNALDPEFLLDDYKIINLATLLVENDRFEDALKVFEDHRRSGGGPPNTDSQGRPVPADSLKANVWRLLTAACNKANVDAVNRLLESVTRLGYIEPNNTILGPTVKVHLLRDDVDSALKQFEECCKAHKCTPIKNELLTKLIELEDAEKLQKVVDLSTDVHGEMNTMYDLAFAFIDCNRVRQARKIFETPGIRARPQRLDSICQRYLADDKVEAIEALVEITRDLFLLDRDQLYFHLLRAYVKRDDVDKALGVWTALQEENVQPSERTLSFLGDYLKSRDRPVPFALPVHVTQQSDKSQQVDQQNQRVRRPDLNKNSDHMNHRLMEAIKQEDPHEALQVKKIMEQSGRQIPLSSASRLIDLLVNKDRSKDALIVALECLNGPRSSLPLGLRGLLRHLGAAGDLATIDSIGDRLSDAQTKTIRFNNYRSIAMIASGRHLELLESMENADRDRDHIPNGAGLLAILESHPELYDRVERLAEAYAENNVQNPLNMVWLHHFKNGNYEKADTIFKANPIFMERLSFIDVLKKATTTRDVGMLHRLAETVNKTRLSPKTKGIPYSYIINFYVDTNELDAAVGSLEEATSTAGLSLDDLHLTALTRLKSALEAQSKPVPFVLPTGSAKNVGSLGDANDDDDERK